MINEKSEIKKLRRVKTKASKIKACKKTMASKIMTCYIQIRQLVLIKYNNY